MPLNFSKMHGLGNDFIILDGRQKPLNLSAGQVQKLAARRTGIGCDQLVIIEHNQQDADAFMRIYNADGGEVSSCGNVTRCVAWLLMQETGRKSAVIATRAGHLTCEYIKEKTIRADMGEPKFGWQDIPLAKPCDTLNLDISINGLSSPSAVGMGNPHMVFVVPSADSVPLSEVGPVLEHHPLFPQRANVSFAQVLDSSHIKLRVWERGAGETLACGTAACAALAALHKRGLVGSSAKIQLPGGNLEIEWKKDNNHMLMTGAVELSFTGSVEI